MTRLETIADETWRTRKIQRGLRDVVARIGFDARRKFFALFRGGLRTDEHSVAAALADGLDDELVEIREYVPAILLFRQQECFDVVHDRIFIEVVADDARNIGVKRLVVGQAGSEGICDGYVAGAVGVEQAGAAEDG